MGAHPHQDYFYIIKENLDFEKLGRDIKEIDDIEIKNHENTIFIVKTEFVKNQGNYTFSRHHLFGPDKKPKSLEYLSLNSSQDTFSERLIEKHQASIKVEIMDKDSVKREISFHHDNGLGGGYSDIDGKGIKSIIIALKLMRKIHSYGENWETYDKMMTLKEKFILDARKLNLTIPVIEKACDEEDGSFVFDCITKK